MATEQSTTLSTGSGSTAKWTSWLTALVGLWLAVSPFVLTGSIASGNPLYSTVIGGALVVVLSAYTAWTWRSRDAEDLAEYSAWLAGLIGLWTAISPFILTGAIQSGTVLYSTVAAGVLILVLDAYAGYDA
ncbi:MAG: SPW repeat protein [Halobacteriaceae archaeon]